MVDGNDVWKVEQITQEQGQEIGLIYSTRTAGVEITLVSGKATAYVDTLDNGIGTHTATEEEDSLTGIENIKGSTVKDSLVGDSTGNSLLGIWK